MTHDLRQHVLEAAGREEVCDAVAHLYWDLHQEIELRQPPCVASGRCCRFEAYGHRLFVTTMELAKFVRDLGGQASEPGLQRPEMVVGWDGQGCPFQIGKICGVHRIRPFGCRIFFCDPASENWQNEQYERFHAQLKRLHEQLQVPYYYMEWRQALRELRPV